MWAIVGALPLDVCVFVLPYQVPVYMQCVCVLLCVQLKCPFQDGDSHHLAANVEKMRVGVALTDEDRIPWLLTLHSIIVG